MSAFTSSTRQRADHYTCRRSRICVLQAEEVDMRLLRLGTAAVSVVCLTVPLVAAQQAVHVDGDAITLRGCVTSSTAELNMPFDTLVWSRSGILTAGTSATAGADPPARAAAHDLATRVLYWIDEDDLETHTGKLVELRGDLGDLETADLEIERDGEFTEIRLELEEDEETIRVPTSWLPQSSVARASLPDARDDEVEIELATRKIDVEDVKVLGPCPLR